MDRIFVHWKTHEMYNQNINNMTVLKIVSVSLFLFFSCSCFSFQKPEWKIYKIDNKIFFRKRLSGSLFKTFSAGKKKTSSKAWCAHFWWISNILQTKWLILREDRKIWDTQGRREWPRNARTQGMAAWWSHYCGKRTLAGQGHASDRQPGLCDLFLARGAENMAWHVEEGRGGQERCHKRQSLYAGCGAVFMQCVGNCSCRMWWGGCSCRKWRSSGGVNFFSGAHTVWGGVH